MCVCMCECVCVCECQCKGHIHVWEGEVTRESLFVGVCVGEKDSVCVCVYVWLCVHKRKCVCFCVCVPVHVCVYLCVYLRVCPKVKAWSGKKLKAKMCFDCKHLKHAPLPTIHYGQTRWGRDG